MANIKPQDKVLYIGSGLLPTGPIMITEKTNANIVAVDNSNKIVKLSKPFVKKKGLEKKIKIEHADGKDYPLNDFDVIFIAANVWPIDSVLDNLSKNMKHSAKIICKGMKNDVLNVLEKKEFINSFSVVTKKENAQTYSFLLTDKKGI